mmetsp:Transcript_44876/g.94149  ORF Transcript_44876/g.94149 Transcript_44876/m.94149 type:complete len:646 (-) Transcript_44876:581-2518(-)
MLPRRSSPPGGAPSAGAHYSSGPPSNVQPQSRRDKQSPPRRQPPHSPDELQFAKRTLQKLVQDSHFFPVHDRNNRVQTIRENEIDVGALIGKGGFCEVRTASKRQHHYDAHTGGGGPTYAMKYLSPTKTASSRVFQRGIADLAMEACFLSLMRHDNIIGLHYVSEGSLDENFNCANDAHIGATQQYGQHDEIVMDANGNLQLRRRPSPPQPTMKIDDHLFGYFLLLDPLHETLTDRIDRTYIPQTLGRKNSNTKLWNRIRQKNSHDPNDPKSQLAERLEILSSIASALKYLHENCRIIFRDIKPDNIGFYRRYYPHCQCGYRNRRGRSYSRKDSSGSHDSRPDECTCYDETTKLFDFGLAKELKPKYRKSHPAYPDQDTYKLTGCTGSRRYMAPEVCFSDPYNERADVYSFGMLLYQVSSLVTPFDGFSMGRHEREVLRGGFRPDVKIPSPTSLAASPFASMTKGKKSAGLNTQELYQAMVMDAEGGTEQEDVERRNNVLALKTKRYWPKELPRLIEECWDYDMRYRPDMKEVSYRLQTCIDILFHHHGGGGNKKGRHSKSPDKNESSMFNTASTVDTRTTGASWAHGDAYMGDPQDYVRGYHQQQLQLQLQQQQYQYAQMGHDNIERRRSSGRRGSNNDEMQWR